MRLGGRMAAAIEVLEDMERRKRPAADALKDWGLSHRFAGSGDRSAIGNIVYDALRRRRSASWLVGDDTPRGQAFGAMVLESGVGAGEVNAALAGDKFAPALLTAAELAAIDRGLGDAPPEIRADCPDWCVQLFERAFGERWVEESAALASRPTLDLRVNTLVSDRAAVLHELRETGAVDGPLTEHGIRIAPIEGDGRHPNVQSEPAFQKGWFEVQDEGSQAVAALAGAQPGMQVLDYCAGAGGKSLALAAAMENQGRIVAHDSDKSRLAPIFDRLRRSGATNVDVMARASDLEPLTETFDIVLIDAPCTGSGTWRRRPDAKWRLSDRQLEVRRNEQRKILDTASRFVKPGGQLVYITCSVFDEENAMQLSDFQSRNFGFKLLDHAALWAGRFPASAAAAIIDEKPGLRLTTAQSGTDGFYFAALQRQ